MQDASGAALGTLTTRSPTQWNANGYVPWDGSLAEGELKVSYKLSSPNWGEVQERTGASTYGPMYKLEADILVDGVAQTIVSSAFTRQRPVVPPT